MNFKFPGRSTSTTGQNHFISETTATSYFIMIMLSPSTRQCARPLLRKIRTSETFQCSSSYVSLHLLAMTPSDQRSFYSVKICSVLTNTKHYSSIPNVVDATYLDYRSSLQTDRFLQIYSRSKKRPSMLSSYYFSSSNLPESTIVSEDADDNEGNNDIQETETISSVMKFNLMKNLREENQKREQKTTFVDSNDVKVTTSTDFKDVLVKNLPKNTTIRDLKRHFAFAGKVIDASLISSTDRHLSGVVRFENSTMARFAFEIMPHYAFDNMPKKIAVYPVHWTVRESKKDIDGEKKRTEENILRRLQKGWKSVDDEHYNRVGATGSSSLFSEEHRWALSQLLLVGDEMHLRGEKGRARLHRDQVREAYGVELDYDSCMWWEKSDRTIVRGVDANISISPKSNVIIEQCLSLVRAMAPDRIKEVTEVLEKFPGQERNVLSKLQATYMTK